MFDITTSHHITFHFISHIPQVWIFFIAKNTQRTFLHFLQTLQKKFDCDFNICQENMSGNKQMKVDA